MSANKVLQISAEDAKYIDPNQIASMQMIDGTIIYVNGNNEEFAEEELVDQNQEVNVDPQQQGQQPALRGKTLNTIAKGALGVAAAAATVGTLAAIGNAVTRPKPMVGMAPMPGVVPMGAYPVGRPMPVPVPVGRPIPPPVPVGRPIPPPAPMGRPMPVVPVGRRF
jgi:hypothetical protein